MDKKDNRLTVGQNGFGRFGLNLLWWWFNDREAPYRIAWINDEVLKPEDIAQIIKTDSLVKGFGKCKVVLNGNTLFLQEPDGRIEHIILTCSPPERVGWIGEPDIFFECSGKRAVPASELCRPFLVDNTKVVIVSATSYDADGTFIMGFNHEEFVLGEHKIISYGSCTVNPGVTLGAFFNDKFSIESYAVDVIHNVQKHRLDNGEFHTIQRKFCTLESMAPKFLKFLNKDNFKVKYTVVPWEGASIIDFTLRLKEPVTRQVVVDALKEAIGKGGKLEGLFGIVATDTGPEAHIGSPYSAVFVESEIKVMDNTAHLFGYFYNEGSSIRMHELASYITSKFTL